MTESIPIDVSSKIISNSKPPLPAAPKPDAKPPAGDKPAEPPPVPGSKTFLGWVARSISRKQLTIVLAAVCSLAAGVFAVRLLGPQEQPPAESAAAPLLSDPMAAEPVVPPRTGPTLTLEQTKPAELIPPASLPMPPAPSSAGTIPPPSGLDALPAIPSLPGSSPALLASSGGPASPLSPLAPAATPPSSPPAIPSPESLVPAVLPAGGTNNNPPSPPSSSSLPMIPVTPPSGLPPAPAAGPLVPALPGTPAVTPPGTPEPKAPVTGRPPDSLVPPVDATPKLPAPPMELSPKPPAIPGPEGTRGGNEKLDFVKPAESTAPTAAATRAPTTSYDVDIYHPRSGDTWESISREYFNDTRYAAVLRAYNQNRALAPGREIDVPPIHVLRRMAPQPAPITGAPPGRVTPASGTDPWNAAGGTVGGAKTYRIPQGDGMSLPAVAKLVLGNDQRWRELYDLNPDVNPSKVSAGTELKLPADARVQ
jgi:hypothetical protein